MTTDITELAQLRGRTVDYPYYLVECDCGKIYPSSELSGGEPMGDSGDYSDCYCPHCGEGEEHFAECADPETAWKAQQGKIDALVEALEKAQQENTDGVAGMAESYETTISMLRSRIAELESSTVTVKQYDEFQICHYGATEDYAKGYIDCQNNFFKWLTAAGIKVEAE
ncbi:TPA: hypothetical protein MDK42_005351 [Klebsiella pneumoniae]|nr:hypothetical protein [Klebsiella pneumoniae]